jgi:hypothetical protein
MDKLLFEDKKNHKAIDIAQLASISARLLLDLDEVNLKHTGRNTDTIKQGKVQDLLLGVVRLAIRHAATNIPEDGSLLLLYPNSGADVDTMWMLPSRDALKAVLDLEIGAEYLEEDYDGIGVSKTSFSINGKVLAYWMKTRLATS